MYGTVAHLALRDGQQAELERLLEEWDREQRPNVPGFVAGYLLSPGTGDVRLLIAIFDSRENFVANAERPSQDAWYQKLRACLSEAPSWTDGDVL